MHRGKYFCTFGHEHKAYNQGEGDHLQLLSWICMLWCYRKLV